MSKVLLGAAILAATAASFAQGKLTGFEWTKVGNGLKVQVKGENLTQPKILRAWGGKSFMLEFDALLAGKPQLENVGFAGVDSIRAGWFSNRPPKVRVHLKLDSNYEPKVEKCDDGTWCVSVNVTASDFVKAEKKSEVGSTPIVRLVADNAPTVSAPLAMFQPKPTPKVEPKPEPKREKPTPKPSPVFEPMTNLPKVSNAANNTIFNSMAAQTGPTFDLEFVNADVVQVLRAVAMQGDANIVTAPDVKGTVTVALNRVTVTEALNLVTALAGLHYAKVGKTYVVSADSSRIRAFGPTDGNTDTRVVPIYSGEGTQVKAAVLKTLPIDSTYGGFEIVLPSEDITVETKDTMGDAGADDPTKKKDEGTEVKTKTGTTKKKDTYVVVIGPKARLDMIESFVKKVDAQICSALGVEVPESNEMVRTTYFPKGTKASFLLASIAGNAADKNPTYAKLGTVELYATPLTSVGEQAISLNGRANEVNRIIENLKALDQVGEGSDQFFVYDVKYMDPRGIKQDLEAQIPGLQVSVAPANAGTPGLFKEESKKESATGSSQSSETKAESSSGSAEVKGDTGDLSGLGLPFTNSEKQSFPMRVLMRGSKEKIEKALSYLSAVDVEPKQVALQLHVMDLSKEDAERIGIDWGLLTSAGLNFGRINQGVGDSAGSGGTASSNAMLPSGKSLNVVATLDAIANNRNLIARPNLFAYDGRQSELFVGDVIRYIESIQSTQTGITVTTKELPVGVRLAVLPRVGGDGKITLDLRPVVSTLNGFTPVPGGGQLPQTSLRIAQNTLTMEDGETIAIGGLIQENDVKRVSGFPILKDLPILGKLLFSRTDNSKKRTELVFFLTAKAVTRENRVNAANPAANEPKKEEKKGKG